MSGTYTREWVKVRYSVVEVCKYIEEDLNNPGTYREYFETTELPDYTAPRQKVNETFEYDSKIVSLLESLPMPVTIGVSIGNGTVVPFSGTPQTIDYQNGSTLNFPETVIVVGDESVNTLVYPEDDVDVVIETTAEVTGDEVGSTSESSVVVEPIAAVDETPTTGSNFKPQTTATIQFDSAKVNPTAILDILGSMSAVSNKDVTVIDWRTVNYCFTPYQVNEFLRLAYNNKYISADQYSVLLYGVKEATIKQATGDNSPNTGFFITITQHLNGGIPVITGTPTSVIEDLQGSGDSIYDSFKF